MAEHANAELARRAWNAVSRADIDAIQTFFAPDIVWHATGNAPWRGDHRGLEAILDYLGQVGELSEVFDASLVDVLASQERALLVFHVRLERQGNTVELDYLLLARIHDDVTQEVWTSPLDPDALALFWAH